MSRKRRRDSELNLLELPWQINVGLGVAGFVVLQMLGATISPAFRAIAWTPLFLFGVIAIGSAVLRPGSRRVNSASGSGAWRAQRYERQEPHGKLDEEWDRAIRERRGKRGDVEPATAPTPIQWSQEVLRLMEWKRLELLAAAYYEATGFRTKTIRCGADDGVDVLIYRGDNPHPACVVQCKAWSRYVGVKPVRELLGVMAASKVFAGVFVTTSRFTQEAIDFARGNKIAPVDGLELLRRILELEPGVQERLLKVATDGDWTTPSCPSCAVKMILRTGNDKHFWGCSNYPRCRSKLFYTGD